MLAAFVLTSMSLGAPSAAALSAAWNEGLRLGGNDFDYHWPPLTPDDWQEVAEGEVGKQTRRKEGAPDRLLAIGWIDQPVNIVWLGLRDEGHEALVDDLSEANLKGTTDTHRILYQFLDLPFPISNRQWVINVTSNAKLYASTGKRVCERSWGLDPRGEEALKDVQPPLDKNIDGPIWTPVNDGGWLLIAMDETTLIAYQLRTDIGGIIPNGLVTRYARSKMDEMIIRMTERAHAIPSHYRAPHALILEPDGTPVSLF